MIEGVTSQGWNVFERAAHGRTEMVSLRSSGIGFNRKFIQGNRLGSETHISLLLDEDEGSHKLGFRFHSDEGNANAYAVSKDGGSGARTIQTTRIYKQYEWLGEALAMPIGQRHFHPLWDEEARLWYVQIPRARTGGR